MQLRDMSIGVVGAGVIGSATARAYAQHVKTVRVYDIDERKCTHPLALVLASDIVFVCLPTPQKKDSLELDTSAIDRFFYDMAGQNTNFVLKSTAPIGFTRRMAETYNLKNLVHSPEFLTARCANLDAQIPPVNIIGYLGWNFAGGFDAELYIKEHERECISTLGKLYAERFPGIPTHFVRSDESEAIKLFVNGFYAVKVAYWNEVRTLADAKGLSWEKVINGVLAAGMIHPAHTQVPGPDGMYGFGGSCLPKDLGCIVSALKEIDLLHFVTNAALARNQWDRVRKDQ